MVDVLNLNSGEVCPFIHDRASATVNDSSMPAQNDDHDELLYAPKKKPVELRNYQTGQSFEVSGPLSNGFADCRHQVCTSTFMSLAPHPHENKSSNKKAYVDSEFMSTDYIRKEAHDFLSIYHKDKETSDADYQQRLDEIDLEIKQTGSYTHTTDEIEYGGQLAWRNASRCINRLFWHTLKVIDRRQVKTNDEMFKEICDHMRFAFNKGTLQTTVLAMNKNSRLWSTQYLRYACYEQPDGSMLGDPANLQLTEAAMDVGWNKPEEERTQWDILPIIVQCDPNMPPSWYNLPDDLCFQIFLSHPNPKYDAAIKSLGLRWFSQPFVSDKAIEIGGIVYRCVPFSGWFMETEVGRDLCDVQRYNIIPKLAALLDLDVTAAANSQLNVDRLYVEVNAAVLYSFEKAKVAIVDHHTAATGFLKFMKHDIEQRGNTPADWVWIVPPISSGMSSVFHQEMLNYVLKPRVLDQHDPWTYYAPLLRNRRMSKMPLENKSRHRWLIIRAACIVIRFALAAVKQRISVNVLYASASGIAQSYAQQMVKRLMIAGYNPKLRELDSYPFRTDRDTRSLVFIITSTFGQGNAPDGGQKLEAWLQKEMSTNDGGNKNESKLNDQLTNRDESGDTAVGPLKWFTYAVCAIGSSAYPYFCGFGKLIDTAFKQLGARRLLPIVTCDALNQQYKSFVEWEETMITVLREIYPHARSQNENKESFSKGRHHSIFQLTADGEDQTSINMFLRPTYIPLRFYPQTDEINRSEQNGPFTKEDPFSATVLQNIELTDARNTIDDSLTQEQQQKLLASIIPTPMKKLPDPNESTIVANDEYRSVRLLTFDTTGLSYYPGDHVCILPENTLTDVDRIVLACGWQLDNKLLDEPCSLESYTRGKYKTIRQILTHFVDLTSTIRPHTLNIIATYATDPSEVRQLLELGKGGQRYADWLINFPTVLEIFVQFRSIQIPLDELIQLLPQLQPRYYSISSSNRFHPNQLHITVSVVTYTTARAVVRKGVCSNYLKETIPQLSPEDQTTAEPSQRTPSKVRLFISPNTHFRLPSQENLTLSLTPETVTDGNSLITLQSPIVMFAIGSGIAPFRSFWQELQALERVHGSVQAKRVLLMGCRTPSDFLYAKELQALTNETDGRDKLLTAVIPVYSRTNMGAKKYIQDVMLDYGQLIHSFLTEENGLVYMCGSTQSCQGIEAALVSIFQSCSERELTRQEANNIITQFKQSGKIKQDMFG